MLRLLSLLALALFATTAHAQSAELEAGFADMVATAEAEGVTVVAGPVVEMTGAGGVPVQHDIDLEGGTEYFLVLGCEEGSGFNPHAYVFDPDGKRIALGEEEGEGEVIQFTAETSGEYTIQIIIYDCAGSCPYGFMVATP